MQTEIKQPVDRLCHRYRLYDM